MKLLDVIVAATHACVGRCTMLDFIRECLFWVKARNDEHVLTCLLPYPPDGAPEIAIGIDQNREHRAAARAASVEAIRKAMLRRV